jgi:sulfite exporter TauE/SafE
MKKTVYISGMHCSSCDILIREIIRDTDGIELMELTSRWVLTCTCTDEASLWKAKEGIVAHGYTVSDSQNDTSSKKFNYKELFVLFLCGLLLRFLLYNLDVTSYVASLWTDGSFGYREIIVLWFIASLSTCLALVGWFVLMRWSLSGWQTKPLRTVLFHQWLFQIGRLVWYAAWWFILWSIGSTFVFSPYVNWVINLLVSILLLIIWRNMLLIVQVRIPTPWWWARFMKRLQGFSTKKRWWFFVGALTFFLPCGFSQLAQINALSTGSAVDWWILLFLFALGTFPVLFILWITGNRFQMNPLSFTAKLIWTLLVVLSLFLIQNAFNLLWWF